MTTKGQLCNNPDKPAEHSANKPVKTNHDSQSKGRKLSIDILCSKQTWIAKSIHRVASVFVLMMAEETLFDYGTKFPFINHLW